MVLRFRWQRLALPHHLVMFQGSLVLVPIIRHLRLRPRDPLSGFSGGGCEVRIGELGGEVGCLAILFIMSPVELGNATRRNTDGSGEYRAIDRWMVNVMYHPDSQARPALYLPAHTSYPAASPSLWLLAAARRPVQKQTDHPVDLGEIVGSPV